MGFVNTANYQCTLSTSCSFFQMILNHIFLLFSDFHQKPEEFPLVELQAVLEEWELEEQQEEQEVIYY